MSTPVDRTSGHITGRLPEARGRLPEARPATDEVRESLRPFFEPNAVAVVGASREAASIGFRVLEALVMNRFEGPVYPINPKARVVGSIRAYASVSELPERVDLAVIVVPKPIVQRVVEECGEAGVRAVVVISAGFAEVGPAGRADQEALMDVVERYGMRMIGPNCLGLLNTDPEVRLNATFSHVFPPEGGIAMSSQSGALALAILSLARRRGFGMSSFVSVGNKADVSGNDLLEWWEGDARTRVILLYLESFGNPRSFARIARRVTRVKPVVAVKAGRTSAGKKAAGSHTGALASSDVAVDALFRQTGVVRAETLNEMFELAIALDSQPLPMGRRVGIVTNAGGPGILCADACESAGLELPPVPEAARATLREFLPETASFGNPIDMIASADPDDYRRAVEAILEADGIDALICIYIPISPGAEDEYVAAIGAGVVAARGKGIASKPVLLCVMTEEGFSKPVVLEGETLPAYPFPEAAARTLAKLADYSAMRTEPVGEVRAFPDLNTSAARAVCREALSERGVGWLSVDETRRLLEAGGFPLPPGGVARSADEAADIASRIGFPVAIKLASHDIVHKTEYDAVRLNIESPAETRAAFESIRSGLEQRGQAAAMEGVLVQPMIAEGVEVMFGVTDDETFGPLVSFGLGGIHVEILKDVAFRVAPVTDHDAANMVREIRGYRLLEGYRGHAPADVPALELLLQRLSRLVEQVPEIRELDLNPVFALPPGRGCAIVDARVAVEHVGEP